MTPLKSSFEKGSEKGKVHIVLSFTTYSMKKFLIILLVVLLWGALFFVLSWKNENFLANVMSLSIKKTKNLSWNYTNYYRFSTWKCYDWIIEVNNNPTSCKASTIRKWLAENFCAGHCNAGSNKCGLDNREVTNPCPPTNPTGFRFSTWICYDGVTEVNNNPTSCKTSPMRKWLAEKFCAGHCNAGSNKCGLDNREVTNPCYVQ